jgi:large subunit ribosomal protein L21
MFAVIELGGKQYKIMPGDTVVVDRLTQKEGEKFEVVPMLVADGAKVLLGNEAKTTLVKATVLAHTQGEKMHVRRFTAKSRHRRHIGFRPQQTQIQITAIGDQTIKS